MITAGSGCEFILNSIDNWDPMCDNCAIAGFTPASEDTFLSILKGSRSTIV